MHHFEGDDTIGRSLELYGEYCYHEIEWIQALTNHNSFVLDIGAYIGTHSIAIAPYVSKVLAFEPDKTCFDLLLVNIRSSMLKNISPVPLAISDILGQVGTEFNFEKTNVTNSGTIHSTPIDMIADLPKIDFVKIDTGGTELQVLNGMRQVLATKPNILINMSNEETVSDTYDLLNGFGYKLYWLLVPTYNGNNHKGNTLNVFGPKHGTINWIATSLDLSQKLIEVESNNDTALASVHRANERTKL